MQLFSTSHVADSSANLLERERNKPILLKIILKDPKAPPITEKEGYLKNYGAIFWGLSTETQVMR